MSYQCHFYFSLVLYVCMFVCWSLYCCDKFRESSFTSIHNLCSKAKEEQVAQRAPIGHLRSSKYSHQIFLNISQVSDQEKWKHYFPHFYRGIFRCARATNSVVGGPIWPKLEYIQDSMHSLVICNFKMDQINN